jgi:phage virion morphogenesis protein
MIYFKIPDFKPFKVFAKGAEQLKDFTPVMARIAAMLEGYVQENFQQEGRPKWKPLNPVYAAQRGNGRILQDTGQLSGSVQPGYGQNYARVSTNKIYARIHHFGGIIKPKQGKALSFSMAGIKYVRRSVTIPARPFMTITREDKEEVTAEIKDYVARRLGLQRR